MRLPLRLFLLLIPILPVMAAETAFPPTAPGVAEFKTLPAGMLLKSTGRGSYFDESNRLFGPLFSYISKHDIAMTTPVEARIDRAAMYFWVAPGEQSKVSGNTAGVEVIQIPERRVASLGARGGYSRENFEKTRTELLAWLAKQPDMEAAGEPYAVYWNGPFTPWFTKRSEVHIPVQPRRKP
jgi:effector-binding domain-containing protein